jgi:glycosyltransferase involved in cell wall biosynthesis
MSSGTPVISTAEGGHGEFLRHNVNALTFQPGLAEDLAAQIKSCLLDPSLAARIARNARQQVETEFSIDAYVGRLESWLTGILKNRTG